MPDWSEKTDPSTAWIELADRAVVTTNIFLDTDDCVFMDTSNNEWIDSVLTYFAFTEQLFPVPFLCDVTSVLCDTSRYLCTGRLNYSEVSVASAAWSESVDPN